MIKQTKKVEHIEIFYVDGSMEKITSDQDIFSVIVEEISMTKTLFENADDIKKAYDKLVDDIC